MSSTPTLFNAGTLRSQLSSCFLTTVPDDLDGIYRAIHDNAMLSKWAGGLGNDWTPVRALGAYIKGTNGKSQGVVPFLKVVNDTAVAVNQGGKRKGAVCSYLETWHLDIEEFLELRKNTGDDRRRTHDMNTANWVPDLFMKRVFEDGSGRCSRRATCPTCTTCTASRSNTATSQYEAHDRTGELQLFKRVRAQDLWRKMLSMLFETGHPWITFKDRLQPALAAAARRRGAFVEPVHRDHAEHVARRNRRVQPRLRQPRPARDEGRRSISTSCDAPYAPRCGCSITSSTSTTTRCRRRAPRTCVIVRSASASWASRTRCTNCASRTAREAAVEFADASMEAVSYFAIEASSDLAKERGSYASFEGSLWSRGILPIDSLRHLRTRTRQAVPRSELRLDARLGHAAHAR